MKNIPLNGRIAKFCEGIATLKGFGLKKAMLAARMMAAMILPAYCGMPTEIERRAGPSREMYGCFMRDGSALGDYAGAVAEKTAFAAAKRPTSR